MLSHHPYDANKLLIALKQLLHVHNDVELSKALHISVALIAEIREGRRPVAGTILILMREASQLSIDELRALMGDPRRSCRMASGLPKRPIQCPAILTPPVPVPEREFP
ncbi:hypothetical protein QN362_18550 [Actimicrobium sp. CCC2.4]|uniref:hypothetical protein n=1 Tax=Actimicrobium sp. CCC2.4 TaxID=3048606 RepID=UPI002AC9B62C|nr:hypothetical protein [Actimicrobium sp. CCC2.4]MEB0137335.1 hypothetical protein [Actimicrobium sp. CCC2.4]WPX31774.1 hypothetical protein RHM62_16280 [Actimicrobium sp. CCC2.4]